MKASGEPDGSLESRFQGVTGLSNWVWQHHLKVSLGAGGKSWVKLEQYDAHANCFGNISEDANILFGVKWMEGGGVRQRQSGSLKLLLSLWRPVENLCVGLS